MRLLDQARDFAPVSIRARVKRAIQDRSHAQFSENVSIRARVKRAIPRTVFRLPSLMFQSAPA